MVNVAEFIDTLRRWRLLDDGQLTELTRQADGPSMEPSALARTLIERNWLTAFQANLLLQGRGQELVLGSYILLEKLGEGGMGTVYKARQRSLERIVAVKVIRKDRLANPQAIKRFQREIRAAQLNHPHIGQPLDSFWATKVAFSPGCRLLAAGSRDKTCRLWDLVTGKETGRLEGHVASVSSVAFSPDGRQLVTGGYYGDNTVRLWEVQTAKQLRHLGGHPNAVSAVSLRSVAISPDGHYALSGSDDGTVYVLRVPPRPKPLTAEEAK